jgi:DNA invertase Pin-like site-specific DNA recombinase
MSRAIITSTAAIAQGLKSLAYSRVSEPSQRYNGSLSRQEREVVHAISEKGLLLAADPISCCEYGKLSKPRPGLLRTIELAKQLGAGIVVHNLYRLIRPEAYSRRANPFAKLTLREVNLLLTLMDGVPFVATILDPSLTPREVRIQEIKRGMGENHGGRHPKVSQRTQRRLLAARRSGRSFGEIAARFRLAKQTVIDVVKRLERSDGKGTQWI